MKIVLLSNYFNHHQAPICKEFDELTGKDFLFIVTNEMSGERKELGYGEKIIPDYVINYYESDFTKNQCKKHIQDASVVIIGSAPESLIKERIKQNKLVFRYSERPLKNGIEPFKYLFRLIKWHISNPYSKPIYMLCASGYTASDYAKFGLFRNRTFKWGYFPEMKKYDIDALLNKKNPKKILWCGRFLDWKHPDDIVKVAERLHKEGYSFILEFIGTGPMEKELKNMVSESNLGSCVRFLGPMKPFEVRTHMEEAGIFVFTSDRREGWGAVLNESMNSGCAIVANRDIGSVPFLIKDGVNGIVYESGIPDMLYKRIKLLLDNKDEQTKYGESAYYTITGEWNASVAAKRFIELASSIINTNSKKNSSMFSDGPCSIASSMK